MVPPMGAALGRPDRAQFSDSRSLRAGNSRAFVDRDSAPPPRKNTPQLPAVSTLLRQYAAQYPPTPLASGLPKEQTAPHPPPPSWDVRPNVYADRSAPPQPRFRAV